MTNRSKSEWIARRGILVVDDCPEQCAGISDFLKLNGFQVFSATCAFRALSILRNDRPSVALIDINMPNWDGLELYKKAKGLNYNPHFILMSGDPDAVARANRSPEHQGLVLDKPLPLPFLGDYLEAYDIPISVHFEREGD